MQNRPFIAMCMEMRDNADCQPMPMHLKADN